MKEKISSELSALKRAKKIIKRWYKILLPTEYMNDLEHRQEFQEAIVIIKEECKQKKREC